MRNWNWGGAALAFLVGVAACGLGGAITKNAIFGVITGIAAIALVFKLTEPKVVYVYAADEDEDEDQAAGTDTNR